MPSHLTDVSPSKLFVACLCAQWCGTCESYRATFDQLQAEFPQVQWRWIDIEDEAELVDPIDIENFPTLLMGRGLQLCFFGTVTPHADTLRRLVQSQLDQPSAPPLTDSEAAKLLQRILR